MKQDGKIRLSKLRRDTQFNTLNSNVSTLNATASIFIPSITTPINTITPITTSTLKVPLDRLHPNPPMFTRTEKDDFSIPELPFSGIILEYSYNGSYDPTYKPKKIKTDLYNQMNPADGIIKHNKNSKLLYKIAGALSKVGTDYTISLNVFESLLPYHNYYKSINVIGLGEAWKKHVTNRQPVHTPIFSEEQIIMLFISHGFKRSSDAWVRMGIFV